MKGTQCGRQTLLVVDDDREIREVLYDRLEAMGIAVLTAGYGPEALRILASQGVAGVLLDLEMPVIGGRQVLQQIRHQYADLPVLIVTGNTSEAVQREILQHGANDYFLKPLDLSCLGQRLQHLLT